MNGEPPYADWSSLTDALLRGIAHALSNRSSALAALRDLGAADDDGRELLAGEIQRLTRLVHLVRLVPAEPAASPEALDVGAVVADAVAVLALHPEAREVRWEATIAGAPQPVRAERWVLLRCLLLLGAGALADCLAAGADELHLTTSGDDAATVVTVGSSAEEIRWSAPSVYAVALAERTGAMLSLGEGTVQLRLPTVAELRRRERAEREEQRDAG